METRPSSLVPEQFGPLQGVRILSTGSLIAQPYAAALAAEMGAEVIQLERPGEGDAAWRHLGRQLPTKDGKGQAATTWIQERRNEWYATLDFSKPEGQEVFLRLIKVCDIWMESSKPGSYAKWGLTDESVLHANPKLVIAHVSGYGQTGHPDYLGRASYDMIGQAFGGLMYQTGFPDPDPPVRANPWTADYITALFCLWSSLAGYIYAQRTGKGQVIDISQFESIHKLLSGTMVEYFADGFIRQRSGNKATAFQPYDAFQASDGWVVIGAVGYSVFARICPVIGLDPNEEKWKIACTNVNSVEGIEFDAILRGWVAERTVKEVVEQMNAAQVACCPIMNSKDMAEDPHYKARGVHIEWEDGQVGRVKGTGVFPAFSLTPGKIWRGSVPVGYDNEKVYTHFAGLSASEIATLKEKGVI
ncbi:MAG TPA: CoA transferase [Methylomirabilota bacterium]|jgi:crotonobetainyl-CoA:carnitine CoA-transferase CaiB-like acyl-CoA transferase|nr:CoA transferase [Methylomirabilota bacterium]